jgi:hypothetical protein
MRYFPVGLMLVALAGCSTDTTGCSGFDINSQSLPVDSTVRTTIEVRNGSPVSGYQDVNGGSYQLRGLALVPNGTGSLVAPPHLPDRGCQRCCVSA